MVWQSERERSRRFSSDVWSSWIGLLGLVVVLGFGGPARGEMPRDSSLPKRALLELGTRHFRGRGSIGTVAFSPDGRWLAAAETNSPARVVRIFEVATGTEVQVLQDPQKKGGWVMAMAYSSDGTRLVCGEMDGRVTIWDLPEDRILFQSDVHKGGIRAIVFAPDGQTFWTAGEDGRIERRELVNPAGVLSSLRQGTPQPKRPYSSSESVGSISLAVTPDGSKLLSGLSESGEIAVWDIKTGSKALSFVVPQTGSQSSFNPRLNALAVLPDGRTVMSVGQETRKIEETSIRYGSKNVTLTQIFLWDMTTGRLVRPLHEKDQYGFGYGALTPDGTKIVVSDFGRITVQDIQTGAVLHEIATPGEWGDPPRISPDGKLAALVSGPGVLLIDLERGAIREMGPLDRLGSFVSASWSPDGEWLLTGHFSGHLCLWKAATGEQVWSEVLAPVIAPAGRCAYPADVAWSPDGQFVVAVGSHDEPVQFQEGILAVVEAATGQRIHTQEFPLRGERVAISPDSRRVALTTSSGGVGARELYVIDVADGKTVLSISREKALKIWSAEAMEFSRNGLTLRIAAGNSEIVQVDAATGEVTRRLSIDPRTPDERIGGNKLFQLWNGTFCRRANLLVSSSENRIFCWDLNSGQAIQTLTHPHAKACRFGVSSDAVTIAVADLQYNSDPGTDAIRLINRLSGEEMLRLEPEEARATLLVFSPDGKRLFAAMDRGTGMIWDVETTK